MASDIRWARTALRQIMQTETKNPFYSETFRKSWDDGWTLGQAEGEAKGIAKGIAKGLAEGKAEGKAQSLLKMLRLRGWTASTELEARVLACRDEAQVDVWIDRVLSAATLAEVFA